MATPTPPLRELQYVPLRELLEDATFRLRQPGEVSSLAKSIAQVGQLFPVELRPAPDGGYQAITGFRRIAALRLLHRERVLARLHESISDPQAATLAAADALDTRPLDEEELGALQERYRAMGWSTPAFEELVSRAQLRARERLEDLEAQLTGRPPPDRSIVDEDELGASDEDDAPTKQAAMPSRAPVTEEAPRVATPPEEPPGAARLGRPVRRGAQQQARAFEGVDLTEGMSSADVETALALRAAQQALRAARDGVDELAEEVEAVEARMTDTAARSLAAGPPPAAEPPAEMTVDELANDLAYRLSTITNDLAALADVWTEVPEKLREILADQLKYYSELGQWLEQG